MKTKIFSFAAALLFASTLFANTFTVSNNPNSPGQYNNLQTAISAAAVHNGDTLLVSGSATDYGTTYITKKLTFLGQGYDPRKDMPFPSTVSSFYLQLGSSGTTIVGFSSSTISYLSDTVNNITLKRNKIYTVSAYGINWQISENIITNAISMTSPCANFLIKNNIFTYNSGGGSYCIYGAADVSNLIISNNHFTGLSYLDVFNAIISNNIFSYKSSTASSFAFLRTGGYSGNNAINNNLTYKNSTTNPFLIGQNGNTGAGNIINTDPKLIAYDLTTTDIISTDNLQLQAASPAKLAGTDGKDIGVHGGSLPMQYPYSGAPAIPQITIMNINNTTIAPGTPLQVQLKANSNN